MTSYRIPAIFVRRLLSLLLIMAAAVCAPAGEGHTGDVPVQDTRVVAVDRAVGGAAPVPHPHAPVSCSAGDHLAQSPQSPRVAQEAAHGSSSGPADFVAMGVAACAVASAFLPERPALIRPGRSTLLFVCRWRV
ncbi:hypothetical protein DQ392_28330 [Streptomyces reniochalinae]|uniref:Lipoprotein n=1 Tax=Streptomyces reniochalinae TaxID=2250578 RepID=A0A367EA79_9ACTN|nr:hypothetical protein [Streptomyces reniochalinae]RCG14966.1 hypothetical protein DQ392_28330 [Streptomyces reniochalinae]